MKKYIVMRIKRLLDLIVPSMDGIMAQVHFLKDKVRLKSTFEVPRSECWLHHLVTLNLIKVLNFFMP